MPLSKKENNKITLDLINEAKTIYGRIKKHLDKRTISSLQTKLQYTTHISSLRKLVQNLLILEEENTIKPDKKLTLGAIKEAKQEYNKRVQQIQVQIKERTRERKAIGGIFKMITIYADEIQGFRNFNKEEQDNTSTIQNLITNKINSEFVSIENTNTKYGLNVFLYITCLLYKEVELDGEIITIDKDYKFVSDIYPIQSKNNIKNIVSGIFDSFYTKLEEAKNSSVWRFKSFIKFELNYNKYKSVLGKSYIELPAFIRNKKACINIKNTKDDKCFDWCLLANKYYDSIKNKDKNETYNYSKYWNEIKRPENISYPVSVDDIPEYERLNNIQINVFSLNGETIEKVRISEIHRPEVVNLLLISDGDKSHYVLIKQLSRLFTSETNHKTKYICPHCVNKNFLNTELLAKHISKCCNLESSDSSLLLNVNYNVPDLSKNIMKYQDRGHHFIHPFHIVADFESTLQQVETASELKTQKYQKHLQNSFGLKYCVTDEVANIIIKHDKPVEIINDPDPETVSKMFIERVEELALESHKLSKLNEKHIKFGKHKEYHHLAKHCDECKEQFTFKNKKVAHHNHITGNYISTCCNKCNLQMRIKRFLPVYIHNLKGYDAHLFINALSKYGYQQEETDKSERLSCIPNNEERYISFSKNIKVGEHYEYKEKKYIDEKGNEQKTKEKVKRNTYFEIRFLDTIGFMNSSIESLVDNLRSGCDTIEKMRANFPNTSSHFTDDNEFVEMIKKGVYPYDYISSYDKLNIGHLPAQKEFFSKLYNEHCSNEDYKQALKVWSLFKCKTFLDYHNLYLKSDVLLLADVWANFRNVCYSNYKLDCEYYYTAPGLSFDAMLKHTKVELELFTDMSMYEFTESGIRGGLSQISHRYAKANNKYMSNYDESKETSSILYLDANNLYGWAMSRYLPTKNFKWNTEQWTKEKIMSIKEDAETGYMFKVDLHIPEVLHDKFNNYVPCPENIRIKKTDLNDWQQENYHETKISKLCTSFNDKIDYVVNYRYLQLALSLGVELLEVKQVLEFKQTQFLKDYIDLNTNLRKKAKNDFEKDFFKLMNNSVFGKTMENVRNRINFRLIDNEEQAWNVKNLKRFTMFSENLVGVHIQKQEINLNKPVYLGQTILDDSKYLMYDFHYNFMLEKIDRENIDLLFTDTDSLCYNIRQTDPFEIMKQNKHKFDLSEYPEDSDLYDPTNKKVIGAFKNESVQQITEFVGLRAKLYAYTVDQCEKKHLKCKGVKKGVAKQKLNIDMYRDVLFNRQTESVTQNGIRSYGHQLYTESVTKTALSFKDDKVFICDDNIKTYNFGHYKAKI